LIGHELVDRADLGYLLPPLEQRQRVAAAAMDAVLRW
jgi:hypothetical protein